MNACQGHLDWVSSRWKGPVSSLSDQDPCFVLQQDCRPRSFSQLSPWASGFCFYPFHSRSSGSLPGFLNGRLCYCPPVPEQLTAFASYERRFGGGGLCFIPLPQGQLIITACLSPQRGLSLIPPSSSNVSCDHLVVNSSGVSATSLVEVCDSHVFLNRYHSRH